MPRPHPKEFRDDVVAVARRGDAPVAQVAKDSGVSESCLRNWLHAADVKNGARPGAAANESTELRELKRRNRLLEQEIEVLRRAAAFFAQAHLMHALFLAHRDDPEFGCRLLGDEARAAGLEACDRTMWRLCASAGWWSVFGKRRAKSGKRPGPSAHDDLVRRNFTATAPNRPG